jgi:hypothetical protein
MDTTDLPDEAPRSPDERFHAVAAILAAGLLRLHTHPQMAAIPDEHAGPEESPELTQKALGFPASSSTDGTPTVNAT